MSAPASPDLKKQKMSADQPSSTTSTTPPPAAATPPATWDQRSRFAIGDNGVDCLKACHVAVIGIGGVGAYCVEALARAGVGRFFLVDGDVVVLSNLNRHILGTLATVNQPKVQAAKDRILSFNPSAQVVAKAEFVTANHARDWFPADIDFLVDACDVLNIKVHLATMCLRNNIPFLTCCGAARRLDPTQVSVTTLDKTSGDPLAALLRKEIRKATMSDTDSTLIPHAVEKVAVTFSTEVPIEMPEVCKDPNRVGRAILPSFSTVPAAAGLAAAYHVIARLLSAHDIKIKRATKSEGELLIKPAKLTNKQKKEAFKQRQKQHQQQQEASTDQSAAPN